MNKGKKRKVVMTPGLFSTQECLISQGTQCCRDLFKGGIWSVVACSHTFELYTSVSTFCFATLVLGITFFFHLHNVEFSQLVGCFST